jgi:hypothetical protein
LCEQTLALEWCCLWLVDEGGAVSAIGANDAEAAVNITSPDIVRVGIVIATVIEAVAAELSLTLQTFLPMLGSHNCNKEHKDKINRNKET